MSKELFDCRVSFAETLIELASKDKRIVAVCNDSIGSSNLKEFAKLFPDQMINVGIAEQNMVGVAAGLANAGLKPFVCAASPFLTGRAMEQIKADIAYSRSSVVLCGMSPGVSYGELGPTHHSIEDMAWMRAVSNLTIAIPSDTNETRSVVQWAAQSKEPIFMRVPRHKIPAIPGTERAFDPTKAHVLRDGSDISIVAIGGMVHVALDAANLLETAGISAQTIHVTTLKPLDVTTLISALTKTRAVITVEEGTTFGGLGSAVAEVLSQNAPMKMKIMGIPGVFAPTGSADFIFNHFDLTPEGVAKEAKALLQI
ncbi:MAG: transketolase family protein [Candidatus Planktophila sp.]